MYIPADRLVSAIDANGIAKIKTDQHYVVENGAAWLLLLMGKAIAGPRGEPSGNLVGGACGDPLCRNTGRTGRCTTRYGCGARAREF